MNLYEQARNLANALLDTREGKAYEEAKYILEGDEEASGMLKEYANRLQDIRERYNNGERGEEIEKAKKELDELVLKTKENSVIVELFKAEGEFKNMVTSVMDVFNATLAGKIDEEGGCSGGCAGCSGCH